jgi:hypothetical protein
VAKWRERLRETGALKPGQAGGHELRILVGDFEDWLRAGIAGGPFTPWAA